MGEGEKEGICKGLGFKGPRLVNSVNRSLPSYILKIFY